MFCKPEPINTVTHVSADQSCSLVCIDQSITMVGLLMLLAQATMNVVFEALMLLFIVFSSVTVALAPVDLQAGTLMDVLDRFDVTFTIIFGVEAAMRIIVLGLVFNGRHSYLRSGWNVLDFLVVGIQVGVDLRKQLFLYCR